MKKMSKRFSRVLGLVLVFAMMFSVGSVYAGDGGMAPVPYDINYDDSRDNDEAIRNELLEAASKSPMLRSGVNLSVPYYQQTDPQWRNDIMQSAGLDIGNYGCALTSFAMVMGYYGWSDNPRVVNQNLGVYACPIMWHDAARIYGRSANVLKDETQYGFKQLIKGAIYSYRPAIVGLEKPGRSHFVVVDTYAEDYGYPEIINIEDPGYDRRYSLSSYLNEGWSITSVIIYS